jgi:hypothetical protein
LNQVHADEGGEQEPAGMYPPAECQACQHEGTGQYASATENAMPRSRKTSIVVGSGMAGLLADLASLAPRHIPLARRRPEAEARVGGGLFGAGRGIGLMGPIRPMVWPPRRVEKRKPPSEEGGFMASADQFNGCRTSWPGPCPWRAWSRTWSGWWPGP